MLLHEFDPAKTAVLNPYDLNPPMDGFPECCAAAFSSRITESFAQKTGAKRIAALHPAFGDIPVYEIVHRGHRVAFYTAMPGAPACVNSLEDVASLGARNFVFFGSCGVLDREVAAGKIIVPDTAIREDGTSYQYCPAADEIALDPNAVAAVKAVMKRRGVFYVTGKTWTTDGFYRETPEKVRRRKEAGAICVEMECAALTAVSQFRGLRFAEFFYAADLLDGSKWDARDLREHGVSGADIYMNLALDCALALAGLLEEHP